MKKETPYFSLVLPVYGVEKYLNRCIESILEQDFNDYEIILVDDGSKDNSPVLCDEWSKKDERIVVIHKKNAGLGMARNTGFDIARGKYVFFIDSDDYILPGVLKCIYTKTVEHETDALFYGFQRVNSKQNVVNINIPNPDKLVYSSNKEIKHDLFPYFISKNPHTGKSMNLWISAWCCCLNVQFLRENNLRFVSEREYISEDIYFYIELFNVLRSVAIIPKSFYCYCQNAGSLSFSYKSDRFERILHFYKSADSFALRLEHSDETRFRLKASFIATTMGCLKMETANFKSIGIKKSYKRVKKIACDDYFVQALEGYPLTYYGFNWKFFAKCVTKRHYIMLYLILLLKYITCGV